MNIRKSWYGIMAGAMLALSVTACDTGMVDPENPMPVVMTEVTETNSFDLLAQPIDFHDATVEMEMREKPDDRRGGDHRGPKVMHPFARLLNALKLTEEQRPPVAELLAKHKDCVGAAMEILRAAQKVVMDQAKADREAVLARLEAGEIDKAQARLEIRDINKAAREALKNLPVREEVKAMLTACDDEFIAGLREILTDEQEALLDRWVAARPVK